MAKILVANRDPDARASLTRGLADYGYETSEVDNVDTLCSTAALEAPDVILLELLMDGLAALERLKAAADTESIPVIVLGVNEPLFEELCIEAGAFDYLGPRFTSEELHYRIRMALRFLGRIDPD